MKRPASGERNLERLQRWREPAPRSWCAAPSSPVSPARPKPSSSTCWTSCARRRSTAPAALPTAGGRCRRQRTARHAAAGTARGAPRALHGRGRGGVAAKLQRRVGATMQVLVDSAPALGRKGGVGRSYADAPEIDGTVRLLPPEKSARRSRWANSPAPASSARRATTWWHCPFEGPAR
jgi:ribosomal protein S12 methylthiotransferase